MEIYITPTIIYKNNSLYSKKNKYYIKINKKNWLKYLSSYGWTKIDENWDLMLSEDDDECYFSILECGGNGDCLFHAIAEGVNNNYNPDNFLYTSPDLRELVSSKITESNFLIILESYKLIDDNLDWDPENISNIKELQNEIIKEGNNFWGDHIILQLLEEALNINIIILSYFNTNIYNTFSEFNQKRKTLFLYYIDDIHFQLIGYFNNIMITLFDFEDIPNIMIELFKKNNII